MASRPALIVALALALCHAALGMQKIKGMAFGTGHDLWAIRQPYAVKSLNNLKKTGINMVHVSAYMKMKNKYAWWLRTETDEASIRFQIRLHKKHGLKVFFKPVIEIDGNVWRGFIPPRDAWLYKVYMPWIRRMARIAQQERVDLFAVGSEYVGLEVRTPTWRNIISSVRKVYFRELTYVANHDSYQKVRFWDAVDVISISAYFVLLDFSTGKTYGWSPNQWLTNKLWAEKAWELNRWRTRRGYWNKKILIAEVGAQSKGGGVVYRKPYEWRTRAGPNQVEQVKMYEGILRAFMPKPWCRGVILWNWEVKPDAHRYEPGRSGYTPQGKMAVWRMYKYFHRRY